MASKDLITLARAKQDIPSITDASQDTLLGTLITAVSAAIEKHCRRDFYSRSYDELYSGGGQRRLLLRQYPVQSVQSVRYRLATELKIQNSDTGTNQQARVSITSTGLTLMRVASGVATPSTVTFAGNPTLSALAAAVSGLGGGWQAQVLGDSNDYGRWPSADLYAAPAFGDGTTSQGALSARGLYAELKLHTAELADFQVDPRGWLVRGAAYSDPELLPPDDLAWPNGSNNLRVQYTAGYTTVPEDVQEACAQWVSALYWQTKRDPGLKQEQLPGVVFRTAFSDMPPGVQQLLAPYREHRILTLS